MSWNHRVLAHDYAGEIYFKIHEVYYDEKLHPHSYTKEAITVGGEDIKGMKWKLNKMYECLKKPILWAGDKFPQEYKPN